MLKFRRLYLMWRSLRPRRNDLAEAAATLEPALNQARALGFALDLDDVPALPPPQENAYTYLVRAHQLLGESKERLKARQEALLAIRTEQFLSFQPPEPVLTCLLQAAACKELRIPILFARGYDQDWHEAERLKLLDLLSAHAIRVAETDLELAISLLSDVRRLAGDTNRCGVAILYIVGAGILNLSLVALKRILDRHLREPHLLDQVRLLVGEIAYAGFDSSLDYEVLLGNVTFRDPDLLKTGFEPGSRPVSPGLEQHALHARMLQYNIELRKAALSSRDPLDLRERCRAIYTRYRNNRGKSFRQFEFHPMIWGYFEFPLRMEANLAVLKAYLEALDHYKRLGEPPDAALPGWIDPCDRKPLRYRLTGDGFMIYSVGPDGVDSGGNITVKNKLSGSRDIVWTYSKLSTK